MIDIVFGETVQRERQKKGITQEELAERSGLHRTFISLLETGKRQPSISTIFSIAQALNLKASELIFLTEEKYEDSKNHHTDK